MTNEEIVEWYRKNEPYVFDMQNQLEKIFAFVKNAVGVDI